MTTTEQFDFFCEECKKWVDRYSLNDWDITYKHTEIEDAIAQCEWNLEAMKATLSLSINSDNKEIRTDEEIVMSAHHEVLELLLAEFDSISQLRDVGQVDKYSLKACAKHKIIHRLQNYECFVREYIRKLKD